MKTSKRQRVYFYQPIGYDLYDPKTTLARGTKVVKTQPFGCPKNGTMGHCYVKDANTMEFIGLVQEGSLTKSSQMVEVWDPKERAREKRSADFWRRNDSQKVNNLETKRQ